MKTATEVLPPPVVDCPHCPAQVRRFPTAKGRTQVVNADPDPARGNIRWLSSERVCVQLGAKPAADLRDEGKVRLYVFHGLDCRLTRKLSSPPRPKEADRTHPPAAADARARVMGQLADRHGWRPGGSWWSRRRHW